MNEQTRERVARFVARHSFFKNMAYEEFAKTIVYLINKYGVGGETDYELGAKIQREDEEYIRISCGYIGGDDIATLLHDYGNDITSEQQHNRDLIKGVING